MLNKSLNQILKGGNLGDLEQLLNIELLKDLLAFYQQNNSSKLRDISIENSHTRSINFMLKYNLKYFGELLERYEERELIKNTVDFRTLVYTATYLNSYSTIDLVGNQWTDFLKNSLEKLTKKFDTITASILLQNLKLVQKENIIPKNYQNLLLKTTTEITELSITDGLFSLSFIMSKFRVLTIFINDLGDAEAKSDLKNFKDKVYAEILNTTENLIEKLSGNINVLENYILLYPLNELYDFFSEPKNSIFKNKKIAPFLAAFEHLKYREITDSDISKIRALMNIPLEGILFLNYMYSNYTFGNKIKSKCKITGPGYERIMLAVSKAYLSKEEPLPEILKLEIEKYTKENFREIKYNRYRSSKDFYFTKMLLEECKIPFIENFKFLLNSAESTGNTSFNFSRKLQFYLISRKEFLNLLNRNSQEDIIKSNLQYSRTLEEYDRFRALALEKNINLCAYSITFEQEVKFGYFDIRNFSSINTDSLVSLVFNYITKFSDEDKSNYVISYVSAKGISNINFNEFIEIYSILGYAIKSEKYYSSDKIKLRDDMLYKKIPDDSSVKLLSIFEELFFRFYPEQYAPYLYEMIKLDWYKKYMDISESDEEIILKSFVSNNLLSENIRHSIIESFKTEEQKLNEKIISIKQTLNRCTDLYSLKKYHDELIELDSSPEAFRITFKKFKEITTMPNEKKTWSSQFVALLKLFAKNNILSKEEVFDYVINY